MHRRAGSSNGYAGCAAGVATLGLSLGAALAHAAAEPDLYGAINRMRAGETTCARSANLQPLAAKPELERAAAALARGGTLASSVANAGYRALRSVSISVVGSVREGQLTPLLESRYCAEVLDPDAADIGIHQAGRQVWIVLAAPFAPRVNESAQAAGETMLALVNEARAVPRNCGSRSYPAAAPVRWNDKLAEASRSHAEDMARYGYFSHQDRDHSGPAQRVERAGYNYRTIGENIAAGPTTAQRAVAGWLKSPSHCANLMNPAYTEMGAAFAVSAQSGSGIYWVQTFARPW